MNYYEDSAGSYTSGEFGDVDRSIGDLTEDEYYSEIRSSEDGDIERGSLEGSDVEDDYPTEETPEMSPDELYWNEIGMTVEYRCATCGVSTENFHILDCPYSEFGLLLKFFMK